MWGDLEFFFKPSARMRANYQHRRRDCCISRPGTEGGHAGIKAQRDPCGDRGQEVNDSQAENRQHGPKRFAHEIRSIAGSLTARTPCSRRLCFAVLGA
jgi:hypothetical protein